MRFSKVTRAAYEVFSHQAKVAQRNRAARDVGMSRQVDFIRKELAIRTVERFSLINRSFENIVDMGAGAGYLEQAICGSSEEAGIVRDRQKNSQITMVEPSEVLLNRDADLPFNSKLNLNKVATNEEDFNPTPNSVDAVLTSGSMHWINDLPGVFMNIERMLVPDGLFMGNMIGGDSLYELRTSLQLAEMEQLGRVSPRLSPLAGASDVGNLMQNAKFKLLTIDVEDIVVDYPDMFALIEDLHAMGESNAVKMRPSSIPRSMLVAASHIYREMHGNPDGTIPATVRVVYMIGWKHSPDQPKPLKRGLSDINLKDLNELKDLQDKNKE